MQILERYLSLCRRYAKRLGDHPADPVYRALCAAYFVRLHGYLPNFLRPTTFTETVWSHMLFDRDVRLRVVADKFTSRGFIQDRVGTDYLLPLLWYGTDPAGIPFSTLPTSYVIKVSHGSGYNILVPSSEQLARNRAIATLRTWQSRDYGLTNCAGSEWAYRGLPPTILVEPFLKAEDGDPPMDVKFMCLDGVVRWVQVDHNRFRRHTRSIHDRNFRRLPVQYGYPPAEIEAKKPRLFELMLTIAERLASGLRLVRVDMYGVDDRVVVGELTNYPGGGRERIAPRSFDVAMATPATDAGFIPSGRHVSRPSVLPAR